MAKTRMINTRFWNDGYIAELSPIEKLLFLYFLTNAYTNICGIYELPIRTIAFETGIEEEKVRNVMARLTLDEKVRYEDGWLVIKNFAKHQQSTNPKIARGIELELKGVPERLIAYAYPIDSISHPNPNSNSNPNPNSNELFERVWAIYPKKIGKTPALRAFNSLKADEELTERIVSAIALAKTTSQWKDNEGRYVPHAATYLNQRRFEDELPVPESKVVRFEEGANGMKPVLDPEIEKIREAAKKKMLQKNDESVTIPT